MRVFIAGSKNINNLSEEVLDKLNDLVVNKEQILIGDCYGVDSLVQKYLDNNKYSNVTIYVSGNDVRNNIGNWPVRNIVVQEYI